MLKLRLPAIMALKHRGTHKSCILRAERSQFTQAGDEVVCGLPIDGVAHYLANYLKSAASGSGPEPEYAYIASPSSPRLYDIPSFDAEASGQDIADLRWSATEPFRQVPPAYLHPIIGHTVQE
jgi:hypothetical protein